MPDIVISYAREDKNLRDMLVHCLREHGGWDVWYDENLVAGRRFSSEIEKQITASRLVVVIWTSASVQSNWVRAEAHTALDQDKLFPVLMGNPADTAEVHIPIPFVVIQALDLSGWNGDGSSEIARKLLEQIKTRIVSSAGEPREIPWPVPPPPKPAPSPWLQHRVPLAAVAILAVVAIVSVVFRGPSPVVSPQLPAPEPVGAASQPAPEPNHTASPPAPEGTSVASVPDQTRPTPRQGPEQRSCDPRTDLDRPEMVSLLQGAAGYLGNGAGADALVLYRGAVSRACPATRKKLEEILQGRPKQIETAGDLEGAARAYQRAFDRVSELGR